MKRLIPRIKELLREGEKIQLELDPLMRGTFRNHPEKLADWDSIMQEYYSIHEDDPPDKSD